jgi:hypothetical protein
MGFFSLAIFCFLGLVREKRLRKKMSVAAAPGGSGGGRKRPACLGGPAMGCDCDDCRAWRMREVDALTQRRIERRRKLVEREREFEARQPRRFQDPPRSGPRMKTAVRVVMGRQPEICPIVGSAADGGVDGESRWQLGRQRDPEDGRGGWKEILAIDEFSTSYINRLYNEHDHPTQLADLIDNFCRDRIRLADALTILGSTCVFLRLVGNRTTGRDLIANRQLDRAYQMEHPGLELALHPMNDDVNETEMVALGRAPSPDKEIDREWESDDDGGDD